MIRFPTRLKDFRDYCHAFYGRDGIYDLGCGIPDIEQAILDYVDMILVRERDMTWGGGDSIDRERVRFILEDYGFAEIN
jgi:hypothetical protein